MGEYLPMGTGKPSGRKWHAVSEAARLTWTGDAVMAVCGVWVSRSSALPGARVFDHPSIPHKCERCLAQIARRAEEPAPVYRGGSKQGAS